MTGPTQPTLSDLTELAREAGIRRVHVLAWRDLADAEAGGSEVHASAMAEVWAEAGIEVTMRTSHAQGHPPEATRTGYRVIRRNGRFFVFPAAIVEESLRRNGPIDALVEIWNGVPFLSPIWFRGPRIVLLHHVHQQMWDQVLTPGLARVGRTLEARIAPPFYKKTRILTLSSSSREEIIDILGMPAQRVSVVHPGVDPRYTPGDVRSETPLVVGVGRFMPPKRFDALVRIALAVKPDVPDLRLVIAGDGHQREELEALIAENRAEDWIRLPGRVSDAELLALYRRAWVVASASSAEGWGMTLTEAAACGTPSVASDIAGHRDAVVPGSSGLLGADDAELRAHLTEVLTDDERRAQLSEGALKHAATLSWEATALNLFLPLAEEALRLRRGRRAR